MDQQFMIDFNYNPNHLEGNALTYGQTKLLFLFGETSGTARLLVNYILSKRGYPMTVIRTDDRSRYLHALHQCDLRTGIVPFDGATASVDAVAPLVEYMSAVVEKKLAASVMLAKGEIKDIVDADESAADGAGVD